VLGWETITNPSAAVLGRNEESDISARRRRRNTLALQGVALPEAIISRVYDVDEVRSVVFRENVTSSPQIIDGVNMIPHSIFVGVSGGDDDAIAYALLSTKSLGAGWNGNTTVDVVEPASGTTYSVQFDRPVAVNVYVKVTARYNGIDAATVVPDAIHKYADGELDNEDGFVIGADVNPFEIAGAINQVEPRIFVTNVELSTDGVTFAPTAVPISIQQIATLATIQVIPV
jgi:bacillopeptidase F (M6 metalloprotease family)